MRKERHRSLFIQSLFLHANSSLQFFVSEHGAIYFLKFSPNFSDPCFQLSNSSSLISCTIISVNLLNPPAFNLTITFKIILRLTF
jgi:hypothetical protein